MAKRAKIAGLKINLSYHKYRVLSWICIGYSSVFLASIVIPFFIQGIDHSRWYVLLFGIISTIGTIFFALTFGEKGKL